MPASELDGEALPLSGYPVNDGLGIVPDDEVLLVLGLVEFVIDVAGEVDVSVIDMGKVVELLATEVDGRLKEVPDNEVPLVTELFES